jgi:single-stranded DNA-binding protein
MSNENNYVGATVTLVGYAAGPAKTPAYDKDGGKGILELSIPVNEGYKPAGGEFVKTGTTWYTVSAAGDYAAQLSAINKGDKVRVDGAKQEVREYTDREGNKKLGISLRYGTITVLEAASGGPVDESPF